MTDRKFYSVLSTGLYQLIREVCAFVFLSVIKTFFVVKFLEMEYLLLLRNLSTFMNLTLFLILILITDYLC